MKAALLLAIFGTIAVIVAWFLARSYVRRRASARRIERMEAENERIDELLDKQRQRPSTFDEKQP